MDRTYDLSHVEPHTVSETIKFPEVIANHKVARSQSCENRKSLFSEPETLISLLREDDSLIKSVSFVVNQYTATNFNQQMIIDINRFCVLGYSVLTEDTALEICESLWLTDTTYINLAVVNKSGKNSEFPGLGFWHFKGQRNLLPMCSRACCQCTTVARNKEDWTQP